MNIMYNTKIKKVASDGVFRSTFFTKYTLWKTQESEE